MRGSNGVPLPEVKQKSAPQAIDTYITDKGYADTKAHVAFSGRVDDAGLEQTESGMNGFPESQTATRFDEPEHGVLIVAEKSQTGYDQPLLHTMFVDKTLTGLAAVQTLSRLNRIHPEKTDTFVLEFRNEADAITEAFKPWYEQTVAIPTDPTSLPTSPTSSLPSRSSMMPRRGRSRRPSPTGPRRSVTTGWSMRCRIRRSDVNDQVDHATDDFRLDARGPAALASRSPQPTQGGM